MKNIVKNYETVNLFRIRFRIRFRKIAYKKKNMRYIKKMGSLICDSLL